MNASTGSNALPPALGEHLLQNLPPVAEDSRLQDLSQQPRIKASPPHSARGAQRSLSGGRTGSGRNSSERARTASPVGDGLRARSPRGEAVRPGGASARGGPQSRSPEPSQPP